MLILGATCLTRSFGRRLSNNGRTTSDISWNRRSRHPPADTVLESSLVQSFRAKAVFDACSHVQNKVFALSSRGLTAYDRL